MRHYVQPVGRLLSHIDAHIFHTPVLEQILSALIDQKFRILQQVALVLR